MKLLICVLCQLGDQKQAQFGNTFDNDEAPNNNICKIKTSKKVECENKLKGKNPTNLKQYLSKYLADIYRKLLEKEKSLKNNKAICNRKMTPGN